MKLPRSILAALTGLCLCAHGDEVTVEDHGLRVRVDGVSKVASGDVKTIIEEQASLTNDATVTPPLADDLAFFVRLRYRELGYREAMVTWEVADGTALLHVNEGQRYTVGATSYHGNTSQNEADLTAYLLRPTHEKLGSVSVNVPFVEADLKAGAELVQRYFQAQGFLDAAVAPPVFTAHPEKHTVDVLLKVKEGRRYVFGTVQAAGELEGQNREVEKQFEELSGQPFNEVKVETIRKNIVGIYEQLGYYSATVRAEANTAQHSNGSVPVVYRITPGSPFRISDVNIAPAFSRARLVCVKASIGVDSS